MTPLPNKQPEGFTKRNIIAGCFAIKEHYRKVRSSIIHTMSNKDSIKRTLSNVKKPVLCFEYRLKFL